MTLTLTNEGDIHLLIRSSFDYCFGKCSYVVRWFQEFVTEHAVEIPTCTLHFLDSRLNEAAHHFPLWQVSWKKYNLSNYGNESDREGWLAFHEWVKIEIAKRVRLGGVE